MGRPRNARHSQIVLAALEERLKCFVVKGEDDPNLGTWNRLNELLDELRRSLNGKEDAE